MHMEEDMVEEDMVVMITLKLQVMYMNIDNILTNLFHNNHNHNNIRDIKKTSI